MTVNEALLPPPQESNTNRIQSTPLDKKIEEVAAPLISLAKEPYPNINHVIETLRNRFGYQLSRKSDTHILLAIQTILCHERHQRFIHHKELQFDPETLKAFSNLRTYIDKESVGEISSRNPPGGVRELMTITIDEMAALYIRKQVTKKKYNSEKELILFSQTHGHIDNRGQLIPYQTLSSELQKRDDSADRSFNANKAALTLQYPDSRIDLLLVRSSRSDNPSRLLKLIQFNILSSLKSTNSPGIIESDKGDNIFRMSLLTAQDLHPTRNFFKGFKKPIPKDEATSLQMMQESVEEIWGDDLYRPVQVRIDDETTSVFLVERPLVKNFNLSKTAYDQECIIETREWSERTTIREFDLLRKTKAALQSPFFSGCFQALSQKVPHDQEPTKEEVKDFLNEIRDCNKPSHPKDPALEIKLYMALQSITISLTNKSIEGVDYLSEISPGLELYYHYYLCELINTSISVQCKAGCDRALIMTSMRLAQIQLEQAGLPMYDFPNDQGVLQEFEDEFISFCAKFGPPILKVCRGNHWMKGIDKPILKKILNDKITENSIQGMKLIKGT